MLGQRSLFVLESPRPEGEDLNWKCKLIIPGVIMEYEFLKYMYTAIHLFLVYLELHK